MEMSISLFQLVTMGVSIGGATALGAFGILKWSIGRNIATMDAKISEISGDIQILSAKIDTLYQKQADLQSQAVIKADCSACRRECYERSGTYQRETLEWMRRQDDKMDRILMMVANMNNGQGGVKNGL